MSIFEKDCPQCASANPVHARRCRCGYCFDPELQQETDGQEERLYRDYLAARVVQAEAALTVARSEASADPDNQVKTAQALLAEQALNTARAELRALAVKTGRSGPASRVPAPVAKAPPAPPAKAKVGNAVAQEPMAPRRSPPASPPAVRAVTPAAARATEKPGPEFRAVQAVKAEGVMQTRKVEPKPTIPKVAPPASVPKSRAKAARPPTRVAAPPTAPVKEARKECPHCTALVPLDATRCRCGFSLPTVSVEMPPVALDAETLALLAQGLNINSRR